MVTLTGESLLHAVTKSDEHAAAAREQAERFRAMFTDADATSPVMIPLGMLEDALGAYDTMRAIATEMAEAGLELATSVEPIIRASLTRLPGPHESEDSTLTAYNWDEEE
jgi:hypothetical protein